MSKTPHDSAPTRVDNPSKPGQTGGGGGQKSGERSDKGSSLPAQTGGGGGQKSGERAEESSNGDASKTSGHDTTRQNRWRS